MKEIFENWLIKKLTAENGCLRPNAINKEKKEINLGLYGLSYELADPKDRLWIAFLVKWFGYKPIQEKMQFFIWDGQRYK